MAVFENAKKKQQPLASGLAKGDERDVEFTYYAPQAKKVCLAGKFNAWNTSSISLKKGKDGTWRTTIKLPLGRHEFKFFVDGVWVHEAPCSDKILNAFGTYNCIIGVQ